MNPNAISRHYEKLTPRERLPLIMAADARGDVTEYQRLVQSASRCQFTVPDHFPLAMAFQEVANVHLIELLAVAAAYWASSAHMKNETDGGRSLDLYRLLGYRFKVLWDAWCEVVEELRIDPNAYFRLTLGFGMLELTVQATAQGTISPDEADQCIRRGTQNARSSAIRVEREAQSLRDVFKARAAFWGPREPTK